MACRPVAAFLDSPVAPRGGAHEQFLQALMLASNARGMAGGRGGRCKSDYSSLGETPARFFFTNPTCLTHLGHIASTKLPPQKPPPYASGPNGPRFDHLAAGDLPLCTSVFPYTKCNIDSTNFHCAELGLWSQASLAKSSICPNFEFCSVQEHKDSKPLGFLQLIKCTQ